MPQGVYVYNSAAQLVFSSDSARGGVVAGFYTYTSAQSGTLTFPDFAGRSVYISFINAIDGNTGVSTDTTLGYPRVTVSVGYGTRNFLVVIA